MMTFAFTELPVTTAKTRIVADNQGHARDSMSDAILPNSKAILPKFDTILPQFDGTKKQKKARSRSFEPLEKHRNYGDLWGCAGSVLNEQVT